MNVPTPTPTPTTQNGATPTPATNAPTGSVNNETGGESSAIPFWYQLFSSDWFFVLTSVCVDSVFALSLLAFSDVYRVWIVVGGTVLLLIIVIVVIFVLTRKKKEDYDFY